MGHPSKLALLSLAVPLTLLTITGVVVVDLSRGLSLWQPPHQFWETPPAPQWVGATLSGSRLYHPRLVLARARWWGGAAACTLLICGALFLFVRYYHGLIARCSIPRATGLAGAVIPAIYLGIVLFPVYLAEFVAIVYFCEVLTQGGVMFATPAAAVVALIFGAACLLKFISNLDIEPLPISISGKLTTREEQPRLFAAIDTAAEAAGAACPDRVALDLPPVFISAIGPVRCEGQRIEGYLQVVSLTLARSLRPEEFRSLTAQAAVQVWLSGSLPGPIASVFEKAVRLQTRMAESGLRSLVIVPAIGLCVGLRLSTASPKVRALGILREGDRLAAAKLGSLDLVRGLLKSAVLVQLWPKFLAAMATELRTRTQPPTEDPYELLASTFLNHIGGDEISAALAAVASRQQPGTIADRVARLGFPERENWPVLNFRPEVSAAGWINELESWERMLSSAERAKFVFERR